MVAAVPDPVVAPETWAQLIVMAAASWAELVASNFLSSRAPTLYLCFEACAKPLLLFLVKRIFYNISVSFTVARLLHGVTLTAMESVLFVVPSSHHSSGAFAHLSDTRLAKCTGRLHEFAQLASERIVQLNETDRQARPHARKFGRSRPPSSSCNGIAIVRATL